MRFRQIEPAKHLKKLDFERGKSWKLVSRNKMITYIHTYKKF